MMRHVAIALASVGALLVGSGTVSAQDIKLRFADSLPAAHAFTRDLAKPWMEEVTKATGGKVTFEHYPAEQLGKAKDMLDLMLKGVADVAFVVPIYITDKMPLAGIADLPGGFSTSCQGLKGFWSVATGKGIIAEKELQPNGVRMLMAIVQPPFQIFSVSRKLATLKDIEGMKLRTAGGAQELTAQKLKAVSVKLTAPETGEALRRGTIDGGILAHVSIGGYGLAETIKFGTRGENFGSAALTYSMSEAKFKALPPDVRKAMLDAGEKVTFAGCKTIDKSIDDMYAAWKGKGMTIVEFSKEERDMLAKVFDEVGTNWASTLDQRGKPGGEALKAFRAALGN